MPGHRFRRFGQAATLRLFHTFNVGWRPKLHPMTPSFQPAIAATAPQHSCVEQTPRAALFAASFLFPFVASPSVNFWQLMASWLCVAALALTGPTAKPDRVLLAWLAMTVTGRLPQVQPGSLHRYLGVNAQPSRRAVWPHASVLRWCGKARAQRALGHGLLSAGHSATQPGAPAVQTDIRRL